MSKKDEKKDEKAAALEAAAVKTAAAAAVPPPERHGPIYRERTEHEAALQVDHPQLLIGCVCGFTVDRKGARIQDPLLRATVYAQHMPKAPAPAPAPIVEDEVVGDV